MLPCEHLIDQEIHHWLNMEILYDQQPEKIQDIGHKQVDEGSFNGMQ